MIGSILHQVVETASLIASHAPVFADADRIGLAVKNLDQTPIAYNILNGNQVGVLLLYYILSSKKELNQLPPNGFIVKSIVTNDMSKVIADSFNVDTYETLTGFKFICNMAKNIEETEGKEFIFGYEESIGYLTGDFVRDKDAVISAMLISFL